MVSLRRASADDISFIMATERLPGYDVLVGCYEEDVHRANLADDNWLYFIGLDASGAPQGFAVLQNRHDGDGSEFLRRFAAANAGRGFSKPFLSALIDWIFTHSDNARCHLHVRSSNDRARHVYSALGFEDVGPEEGVPGSRTMVLTKAAWLGGPVSEGVGRLLLLTGLPGSGKTTLAIQLAASLPACRMCPDDWMMASGIDLWDEATRARIEAFQADLSLGLLRAGQNVVIEWGVWAREERDALRNAARKIGAQVELHYLTATTDELWKRIVKRDLEGRWGSRSIQRHELDEWARKYEPPTDDEFRTYDGHAVHDGFHR